MSEHPADTSENRIRATVAGALTFVSFGFLALVVLWIAGFKTGADATAMGQFTPVQTAQRLENLAEVEKAQTALYSGEKVEASMKSMSPTPPSKTELVVPMSETNLKQIEEAKKKANAEKAAAEEAEAKPEGEVNAEAEGEPKPEEEAKPAEGQEQGGEAPEAEAEPANEL